MKQYTDLIERILKEGDISDDRTGTGTIKIFGHQSTYDMDDGFPLLTLKKTWMKGVTHELLWFLGNHTKLDEYKDLPMTNIKYLIDNNVHIWNEWAYERYSKKEEEEIERLESGGALVTYEEVSMEKYIDMMKNGDDFSGQSAKEFAREAGNLGPVYGEQWIDWGGHWWDKQNIIGGSFGGPAQIIDSKRVYQKGINQIQSVVDKLTEGHEKFNPMDRGLIVSAWNVEKLDEMALRPCHAFFQFQARKLSIKERDEFWNKKINYNKDIVLAHTGFSSHSEALDGEGIPKYELSLQLYQRSADTFLGVPFNIASYSLLLHMICHVTGMKPGKFVHTFGDAHLYLNHKEQVDTFLTRTYNYAPSGDIDVDNWDDNKILKNNKDEIIDFFNLKNKNWKVGPYMGPELPKLWLNPEIKNIFDFTYDDIKVLDYKSLPAIKAEVAV